MNAPPGRIITTQGSKLTRPNKVPEPNISLMVPRMVKAIEKPMPMPRASTNAGRGLCLAAKISTLPKITQLTTINGTKGPKALEIEGKFPFKKRSAIVTKVAMTTT